MAFEIFGYRITKNKKEKEQPFIPTPVTPSNNDGSTIVSVGNSGMMSGYYQYGLDIDGTVRSDAQMITQYRATASYPDVDTAIEAIVNEAVIVDQSTPPVSINLDNLPDEYSGIRDSIQDSFDHILNVLEFNDNCHDIFKRWYIDGKLYYFVIIDPKDPKKGIVDLKYIDPRKIRKVIEYVKENKDGVDVITDQRQYYVFNDNGLTNAQGGIKISTDSIINVRSGLIDANSGEVVSYLFKAIKPTNQLKMMEDSLVIYRITRAPERRVFYVDVGNLPGQKAEQYVRNIMNKFRNKVVYDAATGEVKNNRNYMNMCEDFWLPRREGGKATEIQTLPGCLAMDTKVSLLDGRELSIRDIADEMDQGKQLWTYSCDPITGKIVPGLITWAGVTQKSAKVMKITLDNDESITCTLDHKFPIKGIGFVRADELKINDSLIPLYRQKAPIASHKPRQTYEQVYDNEDHKWYFTHRVVSDYIDCDCEIKNPVIHHADFNRFNNSPDNLVKMSWHDHVKTHNENNSLQKYVQKLKDNGEWEQWHRRSVEGHKKWLASLSDEERAQRTEKARAKLKERWETMTDEEREQFAIGCSQRIRYYIENLTPEQREARVVICRANVAKAQLASLEALKDPEKQHQRIEKVMEFWTDEKREWRSNQTRERYENMDPELREQLHQQNIDIHREQQMLVIDDEIAKFVVDLCKDKSTHQMRACDIVAILNSHKEILERFQKLNESKVTANWDGKFTVNNIKNLMCRHYGFDTWKAFRHNAKYLNHRIVTIELLDEPIEVGTLTIDGDEIYHDFHTFALSCGVFTKNSQNLSQIEDVEYFQRKLYQSMNVPRQRLQSDNLMSIGNSNEITREEVAFSKFIQRLRNRFNVLFKEALRIQLIATKTIRQNDWEIIRNNIFFEYQHDNYFEELKRIELFNQRMTQLQTADSFKGVYFSKQYIVSNVLDISEQQWAEMQQQIKQETIQEAIDQAEVEQKTADFQAAHNSGGDEDDFGDDGSDQTGEDDSGYDDFVNGNEGELEQVDQSGDTTNTIDDTAKPNPGEDEFDRPAATGLTVAR